MTDVYKLFQPTKVEIFKKAVDTATELQKAKNPKNILEAVLKDPNKAQYYLDSLYSVDFNIEALYKAMLTEENFEPGTYEQLVTVFYFTDEKQKQFFTDIKPEYFTMTELEIEVDSIDSNVCLVREDFFVYRDAFKDFSDVVKYIPFVSQLGIFSHGKGAYYLADSTIIDILSSTQTDNPHFIPPVENEKKSTPAT